MSHIPRWLKLKMKNPTVHCFMCCQGDQPVPSLAMPSNGMANDVTAACVCNLIDLWAPERWYDREGLDFWVSLCHISVFRFHVVI